MKRLLVTTLLLALGIFAFGDAALASDTSYGLNATAGAAGLTKYGTNVPQLIGNIIGSALSLVSVIFFILAVYGGFRMMLARGKDDEFTKGRDILIHATIGLIIILASYAITSFVFKSIGTSSGGVNPSGEEGTGDTAALVCNTPTTNYINTVTNGSGLNIRDAASGDAKLLGTMPDGASFEKCANDLSSGWGMVKYTGIVGWADVTNHAKPDPSGGSGAEAGNVAVDPEVPHCYNETASTCKPKTASECPAGTVKFDSSTLCENELSGISGTTNKFCLSADKTECEPSGDFPCDSDEVSYDSEPLCQKEIVTTPAITYAKRKGSGGIKLRKTPSGSGTVLATIGSSATCMPLLEKTNPSWWKVTFDGKDGYAADLYLLEMTAAEAASC